MPAAKVKAKSVVKKATKTPAKKAPVKSSARPAPKLKLVAKSVAKVVKVASKSVVKTVSKKASKPAPKLTVAPPRAEKLHAQKETFFERLIREKAERHANYQKQNEHQHGQQNNKGATNHAKFSKFAGPRRRAS